MTVLPAVTLPFASTSEAKVWGECCSHRPIMNTGMRQDLDENEMRITGGDAV